MNETPKIVVSEKSIQYLGPAIRRPYAMAIQHENKVKPVKPENRSES